MPSTNLARKLNIVAAADGLHIQAHGSSQRGGNVELSFVRIDYKTNRVTSGTSEGEGYEVEGDDDDDDVIQLEAYGIAGKREISIIITMSLGLASACHVVLEKKNAR